MLDYIKIKQIDALHGIITPHEHDLKNLGKEKITLFRKFSNNDLKRICEVMKGYIGKKELGEEWNFTKEYFRGVKIHILYQYYGDEFGDGEEDEIQIFFSGENVRMVSGEDLLHLSSITVNYMELIVENKNFSQVYSDKPSKMLIKAIREREKPFFKITRNDFEKITQFLNCVFHEKDRFSITYSPFPNFIIKLWGSENETLSFNLNGKVLQQLAVYDSERLILMTINHCLRFIKLKLVNKAPAICDLMFSGYYKKKFPEKFIEKSLFKKEKKN